MFKFNLIIKEFTKQKATGAPAKYDCSEKEAHVGHPLGDEFPHWCKDGLRNNGRSKEPYTLTRSNLQMLNEVGVEVSYLVVQSC